MLVLSLERKTSTKNSENYRHTIAYLWIIGWYRSHLMILCCAAKYIDTYFTVPVCIGVFPICSEEFHHSMLHNFIIHLPLTRQRYKIL